MDILSSTDLILLKACSAGAVVYGSRVLASKYLAPKHREPNLPLLTAAKSTTPSQIQPTRSIIKQLEQSKKPCMVFYGSQTGTAERFAYRLAREAMVKYNLGCVVADLDNYDFLDIAKLSERYLVVFILATYGEGEPTDNAIAFKNFLNGDMTSMRLERFYYSAFGLGSSSYTHYNAMISRLDESMVAQNAHRVGILGLGDDGKGTLEEDFTQWSDVTLPQIASHFGLSETQYSYKPAFAIRESVSNEDIQRHVFLGEPNKAHLYGRIQGPFTAQNPFPSRITQAQQIFAGSDRSCLHLEFDVSGTSISYDTGDHLAIWPVNSDLQVNLFLRAFGLSSKRNVVVDVVSEDPSNKVPVPSRSTYEAIARHYLDICAIVTRQTLLKLSEFATSAQLRERLLELVNDRDRFVANVTSKQLTLSQLLSSLCSGLGEIPAINAPFSLILELLPKLRPRHYSVSSSSLVNRKLISVTAVVDSRHDASKDISFRGVSTGYLVALQRARSSPDAAGTHSLQSPRQKSETREPQLLIHVRRSKFRPPFDPLTPVIMIGPGTGVAPFRAFVQERVHQRAQGRTIGRTVLFYGCRSASEDFLYQSEWEEVLSQEKLGEGVFQMHTAFSRQSDRPRQYVQDLIGQEEQAAEIRRLVFEGNARIYICGNAARMAKDVSKVMSGILEGIEGVGGAEHITRLKKNGRWCEDVW